MFAIYISIKWDLAGNCHKPLEFRLSRFEILPLAKYLLISYLPPPLLPSGNEILSVYGL
jgi:hypothetical protein